LVYSFPVTIGGGGAASGAGGSVTQNINAQSQPVQGQQQGGGQTLTLQGVNPDDLFTGRQLIETINQARRDGAVLELDN